MFFWGNKGVSAVQVQVNVQKRSIVHMCANESERPVVFKPPHPTEAFHAAGF